MANTQRSIPRLAPSYARRVEAELKLVEIAYPETCRGDRVIRHRTVVRNVTYLSSKSIRYRDGVVFCEHDGRRDDQ